VFWGYLLEDKIITESMKDSIQLKGTRDGITSEFLRVLQTRGPKAFDAFLSALRKSDRVHIADELQKALNNGDCNRYPVNCTDDMQ